ncbi:MAG: hypothetical protein ABIE92_10115 [bacterium]
MIKSFQHLAFSNFGAGLENPAFFVMRRITYTVIARKFVSRRLKSDEAIFVTYDGILKQY